MSNRPVIAMPFLAGDGVEYTVEVSYLCMAGPRGIRGLCAFCDGESLNETPAEGSNIDAYWKRNPDAITCPMCEGRGE